MSLNSSKVYVLDETEESRMPFLRGILTRSLQQAGMSFDRAYQLADEVRDILKGDITTKALKQVVIDHLKSKKEEDILRRYTTTPHSFTPVNVKDSDGFTQPFSKGLLSQTLELCGFSTEKRYNIASHIERHLIEHEITDLSSNDLARLTHSYLLEHESAEMARRYLVWVEFSRGSRPLILLIGGTTGSGKSTISAEVAHRLGIVRAQSTDMLREVMRLMVPSRLLPTLHVSSFVAWKQLPMREDDPVTLESRIEDGYLAQAGHVAVGIEGVLQRAEREGLSLIIEGVHIHPILQNQLTHTSEAIVVPILMAVLKRKRLYKRIKGRGNEVITRRAQRYLDHFESIWQLQSFLLSEADRYDIPIIANKDKEEAINLVMEQVSLVLEQVYKGEPEHVFE